MSNNYQTYASLSHIPFKQYHAEQNDEYSEAERLVFAEDDEQLKQQNNVKMATKFYVFLLCIFSASIALFGITYYTKTANSSSPVSSNNAAVEMLIYNDYGTYTNSQYPWLNATTYLAEPYKTSTFSINDTSSDNWTWTFENAETYTGHTIRKTFTTPGTYRFTLTNQNQRHEAVVIVKYVKRELRSLSESDRKAFLKAASKLWKYTTEEGRAKYGDKFTGISTLVEEHALASNDIKCDQFHEGSGFFTHHFAITQTFEAALRSIDPSVTVPYWDFTIEGQQITDADAKPSYFLEITPFLSDEWFGSVDENDHIQDSHFAFAQMPKVTNTSIVSPNSYGYVRSYWNNNNDPYVTRHLFDVCGVEPENKRIPDCQAHYDIVNTQTLSDFQILSPNDGHGTVHVHLGGMGGGCIESYQNFTDTWSYLLDADMTPDDIMSHGFSMDEWVWGTIAPRRNMLEKMVMGEYFHVYKSLWRSHMCAKDGTPNLLVCPESCDDSVSPTECKCQVESLVNGTTTWENIYECVLSGHSQAVFAKFFPTEFIEDMVLLLATMPSIEGEMIESASPADIMFWVIHPTLERLLSAKRLGANFADQKTTKWTTAEETWYSFSYFSLAENENAYWPEAYTCTGHNATDPALPSSLPWLDGFETLADSDGDGIISNWEYYVAIDPNNVDGVDYVFDTFDWDHCTSKTK
uniref:PKD domain-containing protein n=1 Tax=viral metagenome TaxID=1070528 RepID=A0A6C0KJH1_9ZZZZ